MLVWEPIEGGCDRRTERHEQTHGGAEEVLDAAAACLEEREEEERDDKRNERREPDGNDLLAQGVRELRLRIQVVR